MKITIEIDNLTNAQALAIEHFMRIWESCGNVGASRWTRFFADGDGNFRPKILVEGKKPRWFKNPTKDYGKYRFDGEEKNNKFAIDYDEIAWFLHDYKAEQLMEEVPTK